MTLLIRHTDVLGGYEAGKGGGIVGGFNPLVPFRGWRTYSVANTYTDPAGVEFPAIRIRKISGPPTDTIAQVQAHYTGLFGDDARLDELREQYAMTPNALPNAVDRQALAGFFFWSSWSASTDRPGETGLSYTSNWPHEPIVGNELPGSAAIWSIVSIILLLAGIAGMVWYHGKHAEEPDPAVPQKDPLVNAVATPSMTSCLFATPIEMLPRSTSSVARRATTALAARSRDGCPHGYMEVL